MSEEKCASLLARRWQLFKSQKRAVVSGLFLLALSFFSLTAELWSNDKPLILSYQNQLYFPIFKRYAPQTFGIHDTMITDYKRLSLGNSDWALWPLNRWDPYRTNKIVKEFPSHPSAVNWFGTDDRGRDIFARLLYGFRYSLIFSVAVWFLCSLMALLYGGLCGFLGSWVDLLGQRVLEILSTVPQLLLLIFIISIFEPSMTILVVVSCGFGWISLSYFVRGEVFRTRCLDYVEAARALGASRSHILIQCILPNCIVPLITFAPFTIVANLTALAGLDYMGLGLPAPTPSWGELLQQAQTYFTWAWWLALFPSLILFFTLLSLTLFGEGIRLAFDPNVNLNQLKEDRKSGLLHNVAETVRKWKEQAAAIARVPAARAVFVGVCLLSAVYVSTVIAEPIEGSSVTVDASTFTASDPLTFRRSEVIYINQNEERSVANFGASVQVQDGQADFVRYEGHVASVFATKQISDRVTFKATLGMSRLRIRPLDSEDEGDSEAEDESEDESVDESKDNNSDQSKAALVASEISQEAASQIRERLIPYYEAEFFFSPSDSVEVQLKGVHDYVYQEWGDASSAYHFLYSDKLHTEIVASIGSHWHSRTEAVYAFLSDDNHQRAVDTALLYKLHEGRHVVRVGLGSFYWSFRNTIEDYWSPKQFSSNGLRTESSLRLSKYFASNLNFNIGYGEERGSPGGLDHYTEIRLLYSTPSKLNVSLGWVYQEALRASGNWRRNDLNLSLSAAL